MSKTEGDVTVKNLDGDVPSETAGDDVTRPPANANPSKDRGFFAWFDNNDGPVERSLILKIDLLTLSFACMGFWVCSASSHAMPFSLTRVFRSCTSIEAS